MSWKRILHAVLTSLLAALISHSAAAQSLTSGDITGQVTDPSGAALPNVTVNLKNDQTGATQSGTTNAQGQYRFSLLSPGTYTVSVSATDFQTVNQPASVSVGQATTLNVKLALASASTTVEVSEEGPGVQTENANISTTFSQELVAQSPNPGNDLSYVLQTAPGATMNTQAGFGNASTYGLPATSNLFTVNGMNENDPFLNLNNSGATNLLLGKNDIQEATAVNNGYSGQYGGLAGANVNYVSKAGSNSWHGNADYWWNGRTMNANNFFNNQSGTPRPFSNANQWAASIGGPIRKNSTFFFLNTEGLRVVLPTSVPVNVPSPQFQAATLANLATVSPGSIPFYNQMFGLWNNAAGANRAQDVLQPGTGPNSGNGCGTFSLGSASIPCALQFQSTAGNQTNEWLLTARVDQNIGKNDRLFGHFRTDHGTQATYTDPISPVFNAVSTQPQYEGQLQETHTFGATAVNQAIISGSWYSALFSPPDLAAATQLMPFRVSLAGNAFFSLGRNLDIWPQGRNVTQYGIVDDFSWTKGRHALKVGVNYRRNDVTDFSPGIGSIGFSQGDSLTSFFGGQGITFAQNFPARPNQPIALYGLGFYGQDEWSIRPNFKLTLALRGDHNSNPVCQTDCFARLDSSFQDISHDVNTPYNQTIQTGLHQALAEYTKVSWQPRIGFAWSPFGAGTNTVFRGGFGLFTDMFPATIASSLLNNAPLNNFFVTGAAPLAPQVAGNQAALAAQANASFLQGFNSGQTFGQITAANQDFVAPSFYNAAHKIIAPQYQEWNFEFQQGFGNRTTLSINYVGNHGVHEAVQNPGLNAFFPTDQGVFAGLPAVPPDGRFGTITEVSTSANSNYNGATVSLRERFSSLQLQANYTWSHALDEVSNAGFLQYNFLSNISVLSPQDPFNLRRFNYGNADYDNRHYFSLNYVWNVPHWAGPKALTDGWILSGTMFARSGLPFTVVDGNTTALLAGFNYGGILSQTGAFVFANSLGGAPTSCDASAINTPCFTSANFSPAATGFGQQRRNQVYGPKYFNTDLTVQKNFKLPWESSKIGFGVQFFNLLNHPNFDQPVGDISNPDFGSITTTVNTPTSVLGSFLGGDASPRVIQLKASLTF
jgi:Carboxypeptidase regulatory-like domain